MLANNSTSERFTRSCCGYKINQLRAVKMWDTYLMLPNLICCSSTKHGVLYGSCSTFCDFDQYITRKKSGDSHGFMITIDNNSLAQRKSYQIFNNKKKCWNLLFIDQQFYRFWTASQNNAPESDMYVTNTVFGIWIPDNVFWVFRNVASYLQLMIFLVTAVRMMKTKSFTTNKDMGNVTSCSP